MGNSPNNDHSGWDRGWDEHKRRQLQRQAEWSLAQKLQWLEDMQNLAAKLAKGRKNPRQTPPPSASDP